MGTFFSKPETENRQSWESRTRLVGTVVDSNKKEMEVRRFSDGQTAIWDDTRSAPAFVKYNAKTDNYEKNGEVLIQKEEEISPLQSCSR